jgi:LmbE family N-acetylglucosaminyl deacetylase
MNVLVLAAHPDDEVLGPGGTICRLRAEGARVEVLILAEGVGMRHAGATKEAIQAVARSAGEALGVAEVHFGGLGYDGGLMDEIPSRQIVDLITGHLRRTAAELVFTHHPGDVHIDHRIVAASTLYAVRFPVRHTIRRVLCYEVLSSTEQSCGLNGSAFQPNVYYGIEDHLAAKVRALSLYTREVFPYPHPRSLEGVEALARTRGLEVAAGAAEAFALAREVHP